MKIQQAVWNETRKITIGVFLLSVIMVIAFIGLGYYDYTVLLGAALGVISASGNFFFMAVTVQNITEKIHGVRKRKPAPDGNDAETEKKKDPASAENNAWDESEEEPLTAEEEADLKEQTMWAKRKMQRSHVLRMLIMVFVGVIGLKVSCFHPVAVMIPFLFPRIVILVDSWIGKKKGA